MSFRMSDFVKSQCHFLCTFGMFWNELLVVVSLKDTQLVMARAIIYCMTCFRKNKIASKPDKSDTVVTFNER